MAAARAILRVAIIAATLMQADVAASAPSQSLDADNFARWTRAVEALKQNHFGAALADLDEVLKAFPENAVVRATRGEIEIDLGRFRCRARGSRRGHPYRWRNP